jgi:ABC-2 type transport system ATP-binding protein
LPPELKTKARVTGRIVQLPAHDAAEIERHLAAVRHAGLVAEDVEIRKADLEDVFLDVMAANPSRGHSEPQATHQANNQGAKA